MAEEQTSQTSRMEDSSLTQTYDLVIPSSLKFLMSNIKTVVTVFLTTDNFNIWSSQITKLFTANDYFCFLDGSSICPSKFCNQDNGIPVINTNYKTWQLLDQNLAAALLSTISPTILPYVLNLNSTAKIWSTLLKRLQSTNRSRVIQLKNELYHISMKNQTMTQYLSEIKTIVDLLATSGSPIHTEDIILYTLNGLPSSYQSFKTSIRTRADPISIDDLYSLLCSEETNLKAESAKELSLSPLALYSTRGRTYSSRGRGRSSRRGNYFGYSGGRSTNQQFLQTNKNPGNAPPTCQICEKVGHSAAVCWHRSNYDYTPSRRPSSNSAFLAESTDSQQGRSSSEWILDSGASTNLTNDFDQLQYPTPYSGSDQVLLGNGKSASITHTGKGILPTPQRSEDATSSSSRNMS